MSEDRLSRIETKLDQLAEAMISMARLEEKMITLFKRMDKYDEGQTKIDSRVQHLEKITVRSSAFAYIADKAIWLIVGVALAFAAKKIGG